MKVNNFVRRVKTAGAFSAGVFVGVCYGAVVATVTTYTLLKYSVPGL
jgi:hypothetical protein